MTYGQYPSVPMWKALADSPRAQDERALADWENEGGALGPARESPKLVRVLKSYMDTVERARREQVTDLTSAADQRLDELRSDIRE